MRGGKDKINKKQTKCPFIKKRSAKFSIFTSVVIAVVFLAYLGGFIPICLSVIPPTGNVIEIDVESYIEKYPEFGDMPSYEKIEYGIFGTDTSIDAVLDYYKAKLENDGYSLKYEGTGYVIEKRFLYVGYLKGITAVGIIITSDAYEEVEYETAVLYMTGNAFDFIPLLEWYQEKFDPGAFF